MRILAVDHGTVRIGLAISDDLALLARPLQVVVHRSRLADAEQVAAIARAQSVGLIVVGLPTDSEGGVSMQAALAQRFGRTLQYVSGLPVCFWDESYSSQAARSLRSKKPLDAVAAAIFLQDYLDVHHERKNTTEPGSPNSSLD
jgi:putative Holliday junction resolvase